MALHKKLVGAMKKERKELFILLGILLAVISATIILVIKLDKLPDMTTATGENVPIHKNASVKETLHKAAELLSRNELVQAENLLTEAIKQYPANAAVWLLSGTVYFRQQKFEAAENAFRHVIRRHPDNAAGYNNLSAALIKLKRYNEARSTIDQALYLAPNNGEILLNAASLYALRQEDNRALKFLQQAMANGISPEKVSQYKELVRLLERPEFMNYYKQKTQQSEK